MNNLNGHDLAILSELEKDSRQTVKAIASKTGLPRSTVHNRIQRMKESGIILKFTAIPDHEKIGKPLLAFTLLKYKLNPERSVEALANQIGSIPNIRAVYAITGDWDMLIQTRVKSMNDLHKIFNDALRKIPDVTETSTHIVFNKFIEEYV